MIFSISFSQIKTLKIKDEKKRNLDYSISRNGNIFITSEKQVLSDKHKDVQITKYDSDFNEIFHVTLKNNKNKVRKYDYYIHKDFTDDGKFIIKDDWIIDEKGNLKNRQIDKNKVSINPAIKFLSNNHQTYIGPLLGRKYRKKKYKDGDIFIFSRNLTDFSYSDNNLETAPIRTNLKEGKTITWNRGEVFTDYFNLLAKDDIDKERITDTYHVTSYNYEGKLINYVPLTVQLETGHFMLSTNGGPTVIFDKNYGNFASGNIYTDIETGDMYVYGFFTDRAKKKMLIGKYKGYYVHKFDKTGKILWKKQISFDSYDLFDKTFNGSQIFIEFKKINDKEVLIAITSRVMNDFLINKFDSKTGKITSTKDFDDYKRLKSIYDVYKNKKLFPKLVLNDQAIIATEINKEVYNYIYNLNNKRKMVIEAKILENGSIILAYFNEPKNAVMDFVRNNLTILKFNNK